MLNKTTPQTAVVISNGNTLQARRNRPGLAATVGSLNASLSRALSSHFNVTYK